MALGAEVQDRAGEQAELHAALDEQAEVAERQRPEARDRAADVVLAAVLGREAAPGVAFARQLLHPGEHRGAVLLQREVDDGLVAGLREPPADAIAALRRVAVDTAPAR